MGFESTSVISVSRFNHKDEIHVHSHCHNFYHLLYVTGGSGALVINGRQIKASEDDIYLIQPWVFHEIMSDPVNPLRTIEVKFSTEDVRLAKGLSKVPAAFHNKNRKIRLLLANIIEEAIHKSPYYKEIITSSTIELLLHIMRLHNTAETALENRSGSSYIIDEHRDGPELAARILKYMHEHFTEKITLGGLAKLFNINQAYLCRIISHKYGISPIQYVNNLRLQKTKELLIGTDLSITEISHRVGFGSIHYLSRFFASKERMSPVEFRQNTKDNVSIIIEEKYKIVDSMVFPA